MLAPAAPSRGRARLGPQATAPASGLRLASARTGLEQQDAFDAMIVNTERDLEGAVARVRAWIARERARPGWRAVEV